MRLLPTIDRSLDLPPEPSSARRARRFVGEALRAHGADGASDVCVLLASELVTNAICHARTTIEVRVAFDTSVVRVSVHDHSPAPPVPRTATSDDASGRGLHLVDQLSSRWGTAVDGQGKVVWFEVLL